MTAYQDTVDFTVAVAIGQSTSISDVYAAWSHYATITVTNPSATADNPVYLALTYDANMKADFSDIRFTDVDDNPLKYWIESKTDSTSAIVWIKSPASADTLRIFIGNAAASSESSGVDVFDFFDDFPGSSLDGVKWTATGAPTTTVSGGILDITAGNGKYIQSQTSYANNLICRVRACDVNGVETCPVGFGLKSSTYTQPAAIRDNYDGTHWMFQTQSGSNRTYNGNFSRDTSYHLYEIKRISTTSCTLSQDGTLKSTITTNLPGTTAVPITLGLASGGAATVRLLVDWILVRKYNATEPSLSVGLYAANAIGGGGVTSKYGSTVGFAVNASISQTLGRLRNLVNFSALTSLGGILSKMGATVPFGVETSFLQSTKQYVNTTGNISVPFANGSQEFIADDVVIGETSGASGIVVSYTLASGSWLAGTAAGTVILSDSAGVFISGETLLISETEVADTSGVHTNLSPKIKSIRVSKGMQDAFWECGITIDGYLAVAPFRDLKIVMHDHTGADQLVFVGFVPNTSPVEKAAANETRITAFSYAWYLSNQYTNEGITAMLSTYTYDEVALTEAWMTPQVAIINLLGGDPFYLYTTGIRPYEISNPVGWDTAALPKRAWNWTAKTPRRRAIAEIEDYCDFIYYDYWLADASSVGYFVPFADIDTLCDLPAVVTITSADQLLNEVQAENRQGAKINRVMVNGTSTAGDFYTKTAETAAVTNHDEKPITLVEEISGEDVDQTYVDLRAANQLAYWSLDPRTYRAQFGRFGASLRLMQKVTFAAGLSSLPDGDYRIIWIEYYQKGVNLVVSVQLIPEAVLQAQRKLTRVLGEAGSQVAAIEAVVQDTIDVNIPLEEIAEVISVTGSVATVKLQNGSYTKGIII